MRWIDRTFADALAFGREVHGGREAFVAGNVRLSFTDLAREADRFAAGLLAAGIGRGDKVGVWLPDGPEWMIARWAVPSIGAVLVPINTRFRDTDLRYVLKQSDCCALVMRMSERNVDYASILALAVERDPRTQDPRHWRLDTMPQLRTVIGVGGDLAPSMIPFDEVAHAGDGAEAQAALANARAALRADDVAQILYTSGTTSFPKGAMVRHGALLQNNFNNAARMRLSAEDRFLASAPLFSATGTSYTLYSFLSGAAVVVGDRFTAESFCAVVERERITATFFVEPMVHDLRAIDRSRFRLDSLRTGTGSPLSAASFRWIVEELGVKDFTAAYGMSETSNAIARSHCDEPLEDRITTCGLPVPGVELRIDDVDSGAPLPVATVGEIRIRGFPIMAGYYNMPEETAKAIDVDGWLHTGDLGELRADGRLVYRGRLKEMIKPNGFNVATLEVEEFIKTLPGVREVVLVGIPDERSGEVGYAYVETHPGVELAADEIVQYCKRHIASYKVPRGVEFVTDWPRTSTGKVRKLELRDRARQRTAS